MSQTNNTSGKKDSRRKSDDIDYFSETAIAVYFLVAFVIILAVGFYFIEILPEWYLYVIYFGGFLAFIAIFILSDGFSGPINFNSSGGNSTRRNYSHNNGKTLFNSSGTKQKSSWNNVGYNDDYERGNREIWKNKWDQEAWNDHEYSCNHDDPWECRDGNHF